MKRTLFFLTTMALVLAACGGGSNNQAGTTSSPSGATTAPTGGGPLAAAIRSKGKLVVGTKIDQPLFGLMNPATNKPEGFDVEMAKIVANAIFGAGGESKIEYVEAQSKNREPFIQDGKVDIVVATYTINDARKQLVDFSRPYYVAGQDIMVKKSDTAIKSVTDLNGKKVCSVTGSTSEKNIKEQAPSADLVSLGGYSECAAGLADGRYQAVSTDNVILLGLIEKNPDFKLVGKTFTKEPYGIGFKKDSAEFKKLVDDTLDASFKDGRWKKAWDSTVGKVGGPAPEPPPAS